MVELFIDFAMSTSFEFMFIDSSSVFFFNVYFFALQPFNRWIMNRAVAGGGGLLIHHSTIHYLSIICDG